MKPAMTHAPTTAAADPQHVRIVIGQPHVAVLDPPIREVADALTYPVTTFRPGPAGVVGTVEMRCGWDIDIKGRLAIPAGQLGRVLRRIADLGYKVEVEDLRTDRPRFERV